MGIAGQLECQADAGGVMWLAGEPRAAVLYRLHARCPRGLDKLPLPAATALYEHLTGPVAGNPYVGYAGGLQRKRALVELGQALPPRLPSPAVPGYG